MEEIKSTKVNHKFEKKGIYLPSGPDQKINDIQFVIKVIRAYDKL